MRIQYSPSISVFLSVLIIISACQGDAHRMYMDVSDPSATSQSGKAHDASSMSLQVITDVLPVVHSKEASVQTSSATPSPSSSGDGESPMSAQISPVQESEAPEDAKLIAVTANEATDAQIAPEYSPYDHETWFHEFVNAVENPEVWTWNDIETVLHKGRSLGYLTRPIAWDDDEYTPLHYAAEVGDLDVVQELTEKYKIFVDIAVGTYKSTPLHLSALKGHLEVVKYLISKGADWRAVDSKKSNSLHYASLGIKGHYNTEIVKFLIEGQRADYKSLANNEFSLLYLAIKAANVDLVRYIADKFPALLSMETCSVSPLAFAQYRREAEIATIIQQKLKEEEKKQDPYQPIK